VVTDKSDFVEMAAQVTAGYKENTVLVGSGEMQIAMGNAYDIHQAYNNEGGYANMPELKNIRRMFGFTPTYLHLIVRADSDIYSVSDLKGKRYNMNTPSSTTYPIALHVLQSAGLDIQDVKVFEVATGSSLDGIRDNLFDCTANTYGIGASALLELSSTVPIRIIPLSEDEFKKLNEIRYGTTQYTTIPANTYNGQKEDTKTFVHYNILYAHKDADVDAVYDITKHFWENLDELQKLNVGFNGLDIKNADAGPSTVPMHPGAEKYFKEIGIIK
jgi:TRAP transporter TAXI family solute receptor